MNTLWRAGLLEYCGERAKELTAEAVYVDDSRTGADPNREGLLRMLRDVEGRRGNPLNNLTGNRGKRNEITSKAPK